jgi:hypothetical protein
LLFPQSGSIWDGAIEGVAECKSHRWITAADVLGLRPPDKLPASSNNDRAGSIASPLRRDGSQIAEKLRCASRRKLIPTQIGNVKEPPEMSKVVGIGRDGVRRASACCDIDEELARDRDNLPALSARIGMASLAPLRRRRGLRTAGEGVADRGFKNIWAAEPDAIYEPVALSTFPK